MASLLRLLLSLSVALLLLVRPAHAVLNDDSYDGNIYALYAGNGSLVPPTSTLQESRAANRTSLDASAVSKRFAPVVSELQRLWTRSIDLLPLTTDELQGREGEAAVDDPARYWNGRIPQVVVIAPDGRVVLDQDGQVPLASINAAIAEATGLPAPELPAINPEGRFNEVNIEVTAN